jgi:hypothetical protein
VKKHPAQVKQSSVPLPHRIGRTENRSRLLAVLVMIVLVLASVVALLIWLIHKNWQSAPSVDEAGQRAEAVCLQFIERRNADDPRAHELLGVQPVMPQAPISADEAQRLQTDFFLRGDLEYRGVKGERGGKSPRFRLSTRGNVTVDTLTIRTPSGTERSQRTMTNPDLIVEVRDGKIHGLRAELHMGD